LEDREEPDPNAGMSVADDLLQQAMAEADDDLRYVGSGCWIPSLTPSSKLLSL